MKDFIVNDEKSLEKMLTRVRTAQEKFASYTQEQVDNIFFAAAAAADKARITLAKMAVEETGMGVFEDKVIKNHYAAEYIYNKYKDAKTCGVIERDEAFGIRASRSRSACSRPSFLPPIPPPRRFLRR